MKKREIGFSPYEMAHNCWCSGLWWREILEIKSAAAASGHCCHLEHGDVHDPRWFESSCHPIASDSCIAWLATGGLGSKIRTAKSPSCTIWWKSTYTASLGPLVWILWVQRCPEWGAALLEHSLAVLRTGTVWILPFPCSVSSSEAGTEEKAEQGCKTLTASRGLWRSSASPGLAWSGKDVSWHEVGRVGKFVSRTEPDTRDISYPYTCSRTGRGFIQSSLQLWQIENSASKAAWGP